MPTRRLAWRRDTGQLEGEVQDLRRAEIGGDPPRRAHELGERAGSWRSRQDMPAER
jgi:hypothetical protein